MKHWFREQMAMYTAYHRNPINCATHYVGVPLIVFSLLMMMSFVPFWTVGTLPVTLATVFLSALLLVYVIAIPLVGALSVVVYLPVLWLANQTVGGGTSTVWMIIGATFIGGWIIQIVGHVFEGRKPALVDNFLQVFMAPAFLVAEALFAAGLLSAIKADLEARSVKYEQAPA